MTRLQILMTYPSLSVLSFITKALLRACNYPLEVVRTVSLKSPIYVTMSLGKKNQDALGWVKL